MLMLMQLSFSLTRRAYKSDRKHIVYLQSCLRRRLARKELKALRAEARSINKFKEISYKLENKVVELTQRLQERTSEKKELQSKLTELEQQLSAWVSRHEEADSKAKQLHADLQNSQAEIAQRDQLLAEKADVEKRLEDTMSRLAEREATVNKLQDEIRAATTRLESQQKQIDSTPARTTEDSSVILTLKNEVSNLREQLNRANALNALTRGTRAEPPVSPTFAPNLKTQDSQPSRNGAAANNRHVRRHSSAGVYSLDPSEHRTSMDEVMLAARRGQSGNPRAVSVAFNDGLPRLKAPNGFGEVYNDPAEEKIKLMLDAKHLDEDVLEGLVRGLKIPTPSLTNPSAVKEILFPANLISLVTNEMWKYGLIPESERFLANVMQTVQSHVMVSWASPCVCTSFLISCAVIPRRRCYHSWHLLVIERT
jgi:myosin-5